MTVSSPTFTADEQRTLLDAAEEAVRARLEGRRRTRPPLRDLSPGTEDLGASFVTLRDGSRLLGCVGTMVPIQSLVEDVSANAVNAAFADPRLPALQPEEFERMEIKVSVLGPLEPVAATKVADLLVQLEPHLDGVVIQAGSRRGTFLPSVWDQVRSTDEFLRMLWEKAGLRPDTWPRQLEVRRYRTADFGDPGPRPPIRA